jgi:uncharacterized membrane protein (TIGR02234 family)
MTPRRVRALALTTPILVAALALLSWTQSWVRGSLTDGQSIAAAGDIAAPAIPPLAFAALALTAALALAGVVFRVILGVLLSLLSAAILTSALLALVDPIAAAAAAITALSGVEGVSSVRALVTGTTITAWPWVALVAGLIGLVGGVLVALTARRWPARARRYDAVRLVATAEEPDERADPLSAWDDLSDGRDPTAG